MNKLTKDKRDRLILVGTITAMVIASLWFLIIGQQHETMAKMVVEDGKLKDLITKAEATIKTQVDVEKRLIAQVEILRSREAEMAPEDDPYAWMLDVMNRFCQGRQIVWTLDKPEFRTAEVVPGFSYKTAIFHFKGTAFFSVIGRFIADFENGHPLFQIRGVTITPVGSQAAAHFSGAAGGDDETLAVDFLIVTPVRPVDAQSITK